MLPALCCEIQNVLLAPHHVVEVSQATVALCGSVELCYLWYVEARGELFPDGLAQAVTERHTDLVFTLYVLYRLVQQVPAYLPDVLDNLGIRETNSQSPAQ